MPVPAKAGFDIYMDESEPEDRNSYTGREGMAFEDVYEVDASTLKSDLHFLLDFSTGNLTHLQLMVLCIIAYGVQQQITSQRKP